MGYNMEGCKSNMADIIGSQGVEENVLGKFGFEYAKSDSVGNSGGILYVWDLNSFVKHNVTRSDYFVMLRGVWRMTGQLVLLIVVYAPQEVNMYGSKFNAYSAMVFNSFILNSGLVEVSLGGCSFTWCHKTAAKMSKLDRFLVSESFFNSCPNINAITLEMYLSGHRPILLRDAHVDYGPTPLRFFYYWLEMEGFAKMVEDGWRDSPCNSNRDAKAQLKLELEVVDSCIDNGNGTVEDIKRRVEIVNKLQDIDKLHALETVQKAKGDIVSEVQSAFIAGRQILDGPFILNEVLQWCNTKKKQALIFKVDFEKTYDSACLKSSRGSVIINGSPTEEFRFDKGLKQEDPLSPFLFLLIMESLHLSFQHVVDARLFQGLQLGGSVNLSHMFFADDAVFVGQWSEGNINSLMNILECFNMASGLKINMRKSKIMGVHVTRDKVDKATTKLRCLVLKAPFYISDLWLAGQCPDLNHGVRLIMRWWDVPEAEFESYAGWLDFLFGCYERDGDNEMVLRVDCVGKDQGLLLILVSTAELRRSGRVKSKSPVVEENTASDAYFVHDESSGDDFVDGNRKGIEVGGAKEKGESSKASTSKPKKEEGKSHLLDFKVDGIPSKLGFYVANNFNVDTMEIKLKDTSIVITQQLIGKMLGIKNKGVDITVKVNANDDKMVKDWDAQFKKGKEITPSYLKSLIRKSKVADMNFKLNFIVMFTSVMGNVKPKGICDLSVLHYIVGKQIWEKSIGASMYGGVLRNAKKGGNRICPTVFLGPITCLAMLYVDGTVCNEFNVGQKRPPTSFWTMELLKERE
uniref:RNA-directed DNA polymerase, eukaryota, reverse transcriptase zinc-binding domain protein n=1 Tax=Tanacetum cinerariifolium TaxID=118510 RepID=A0A6L2MKP4_TANCI|nr:RNA-directed DNA polymerase, eukaryota, reverse transcriptase zinc-binding domain protein [Tanacetum cinerariifolium]